MIEVRELRKTFRSSQERVAAVDDVTFSVPAGKFYVLLGPSGSGKTTTLRCIAGLEHPDSGEIQIAGVPVYSSATRLKVPAEERPIGMVFQSYALWPHMNVSENITFPLRYGARHVSPAEARRRLDQVLGLLHLENLARRPVTALSGGQQQRVALARALALEPKVLLMDEPLSNLDAKLRSELRSELKQLTRRVSITTIYVTHDQVEALVLGDIISVMNVGRILQEGTPRDVYQYPHDLFVARFLGEANLIEGRVATVGDDRCSFESAMGVFDAICPVPLEPGNRAVLAIRTEYLKRAPGPGPNRLVASVVDRQFLGDVFLYQLRSGTADLQIRLSVDEVVGEQEQLYLELPAERAFVFPSDTSGPTAPQDASPADSSLSSLARVSNR